MKPRAQHESMRKTEGQTPGDRLRSLRQQTRTHSTGCSRVQSGTRSQVRADCVRDPAQPIARIREEEHRAEHSSGLHVGVSL
jgi:hypothetical protein